MILRAFLVIYDVAWTLLLPLALLYLRYRGRRDPRYVAHLSERFARHTTAAPGSVWVHSVSLGETRAAIPLIRALLQRGERVLTTHLTPAGRAEVEIALAGEIAAGRVRTVWVPFDASWAYRRFFAAFRPKFGLAMEGEVWPGMVFAARRAGVALFMCNAQYSERSQARDSRGLRLRQRVMAGFAGAFVKSELQAQRFRAAGVPNVVVTGEFRFDQPIPQEQLDAARELRLVLAPGGRSVIAIASAVEGEDTDYIEAIHAVRSVADAARSLAPLVVYVPRAPERFGLVAERLAAEGWSVLRRSQAMKPGAAGLLTPPAALAAAPDIFLGDSLGEMYFYLSLADRVVVGGGFTPRGAHNVIEPLALSKPVWTGPHTWTIEYPFVEAEAAGVAASVPDAAALAQALTSPDLPTAENMEAFVRAHSGAVARTMEALAPLLDPRTAA